MLNLQYDSRQESLVKGQNLQNSLQISLFCFAAHRLNAVGHPFSWSLLPVILNVHRVVVLGVPRQGARLAGLSLEIHSHHIEAKKGFQAKRTKPGP